MQQMSDCTKMLKLYFAQMLKKKKNRKTEEVKEGATSLEPAPAKKGRTVSVRTGENGLRALKNEKSNHT